MHRRPICALLPISIALLVASPAVAAPLLDFGVQARTSIANCPSFCTDFVFGTGALGGPGATFANSDIADPFKGEAHAQSTFAPGGGIATPELKASAFSNSSQGSAFATAFAAEGYTNVSGAAETFTLGITLTADVSDPTPLDGDTFVRAELVIYEAANFFFSQDRPTLELEAGAVVVDETVLTIDDDGVTTERTGSFTFTLDPGESVYLWALMRAEAEREESYADAFGTLTFDFEDATGLAAASVPEPGLASLLAGALALALVPRPGGRARPARPRASGA